MSRAIRIAAAAAGVLIALASTAAADPAAPAAPATVPSPSSAMQMVAILTIVTLIPAIVMTCTTFARFVIVLGFVRTGLGTPGSPPNQVLVGTALFMTMFVMAPVYDEVKQAALTPYLEEQIGELEALERAEPAVRRFLLSHTREEDLAMFFEVSGTPRPDQVDDVPLRLAIPAFILSELRTAFELGLTILLPFLVIDMLVALILSALGMMMMPPVVVAMPLKLMVFVAVDGWRLLVESLLRGAM